MLQLQSMLAAAHAGGDPLIRLVSIFWMILGAGLLIHIFRQVPTGVYRVQWKSFYSVQQRGFRRKYTDFRRDDDPYLFWGHVICDATFCSLFFLLGLVGIIWSLFH